MNYRIKYNELSSTQIPFFYLSDLQLSFATAIFIPKGEVNLIESIIAVANDNCKSDK